MNEEIELITEETRERMEKALEHLEHELARLRAGRSNPALLDGITVDYYGVNSPLTQVSNINTPDPKTILIQPWEKNMLGTIEKAIMAANIGLTPVNNGEVIRINIPPLTEERRHQLVKQVRNEGETAKISIRTARKWANDELKQLLKDGLPEDLEKEAVDIVQEMTHSYSEPATREDILEFLRDGPWREVLDADEVAMLQGVLEVSETQVRDVMVPRSQMVVVERDAPKAGVLRTIVEAGHSRFPVIGEDRDEVVGVLLAKDILRYFVETPDQEFDLKRFIRPAIVIPESKRLNTLLKEFRINRNHIAIVVDEYGGTAGLLTIEDVLEEIVGEIGDEYDAQEAHPIQKHGEGNYHVLALTRVDDFNEYFGATLPDEEYDTVGGLVMYELGRLPRKGESVSVGGFRFKVLQTDRRRIHSLEVTPEPAQPSV